MVELGGTGWDEISQASGVYPRPGNPWERYSWPLESAPAFLMDVSPAPAVLPPTSSRLIFREKLRVVARGTHQESPIEDPSRRIPVVLATRLTRQLLAVLSALHERKGQK